MCLATVFVDKDEESFAKSVTNYSQSGSILTFTTIFGEQKEIEGTIDYIDFTDSMIHVLTK